MADENATTTQVSEARVSERDVREKLRRISDVLNSVFPGSETTYEELESVVERLERVARWELLKGAENHVNIKL